MSVRINEITVVDVFNKQKILRAVLAADPDRPCVGCALHRTTNCLDCCEDFVEDGYHFEPAEKTDPVSTQLQAIESAYGSAGCERKY